MIYLTLFIEFFKVGLFSFGGGFGMIPLIQDAVIRHNWMSEDAFYNFIGVCESTPGPIAVNMATYVGSTQAGLPGGIVATLGVITPSFFYYIINCRSYKKSDEKYLRAGLPVWHQTGYPGPDPCNRNQHAVKVYRVCQLIRI